jgi:predicted alpha/beta-fold hydrolase
VLSYNPVGAGIPCLQERMYDYVNLKKDLEYVLNYVYEKHNKPDIYFIGFSLGSSYGI